MTLFNNDTTLKENAQIRAIKKGISSKNTVFDRLRKKMINELKTQ